jgi:hypothetical protein
MSKWLIIAYEAILGASCGAVVCLLFGFTVAYLFKEVNLADAMSVGGLSGLIGGAILNARFVHERWNGETK